MNDSRALLSHGGEMSRTATLECTYLIGNVYIPYWEGVHTLLGMHTVRRRARSDRLLLEPGLRERPWGEGVTRESVPEVFLDVVA